MTTTARALLAELEGVSAAIAAEVGPDDDLQAAGLDSADLIQLGLLIEERLGVELDTGDLDRLSTIAGIEATLRERMGP